MHFYIVESHCRHSSTYSLNSNLLSHSFCARSVLGIGMLQEEDNRPPALKELLWGWGRLASTNNYIEEIFSVSDKCSEENKTGEWQSNWGAWGNFRRGDQEENLQREYLSWSQTQKGQPGDQPGERRPGRGHCRGKIPGLAHTWHFQGTERTPRWLEASPHIIENSGRTS